MNSQIDYKMNTLKRKNWKKLVETLKYKTFIVSTLLNTPHSGFTKLAFTIKSSLSLHNSSYRLNKQEGSEPTTLLNRGK